MQPRVFLELDHEELRGLQVGVVVEGWEKRRSCGRIRRAWLASFNENERRKALQYYKLFHLWTMVKGIPQSRFFTSGELQFVYKLTRFFGTI